MSCEDDCGSCAPFCGDNKCMGDENCRSCESDPIELQRVSNPDRIRTCTNKSVGLKPTVSTNSTTGLNYATMLCQNYVHMLA